jgi:hypothetical protein
MEKAMTKDAAKKLLIMVVNDLEGADLRHFVVYAKCVEGGFWVVVGTVFRDIMTLIEPGTWFEYKWMLGLEDKS